LSVYRALSMDVVGSRVGGGEIQVILSVYRARFLCIQGSFDCTWGFFECTQRSFDCIHSLILLDSESDGVRCR